MFPEMTLPAPATVPPMSAPSPLSMCNPAPWFGIGEVPSAESPIVFAWNFADSIVRKHENYSKTGGRFIVPLPELREL